LNKQRDEYQELFEQVPCYITVQDRDLRLIRHNREFASTFEPRPGAFCFEVYKCRCDACPDCPVLQTFNDGLPHFSEECGVDKKGKEVSWMCRTSPLRDEEGNIVAVMQMSLDATERRVLEEEIRRSEQKYREIFNNIPNPIFVVARGSLDILDFNDSVAPVYGYAKADLVGTSFLDMFEETERHELARELVGTDSINQVRQKTKDGRTIFVNIRVSHSEYLGREALLVSTIDITKHLMAEQQLIQASKMATLGEMATGIAHELNQPLSVIKTASSFIVKKVGKAEPIQPDILSTMAGEIDGQVDRASRIINHLREFGRKSEVQKERVDVNEVLEKALAIFMQQLKLRKIDVVKRLGDVPPVMANANRLEQVFVNLLINARDAIEEKGERLGHLEFERTIFLSTGVSGGKVVVEVRDTGAGIPKGLAERIFEPFFTTKRVGKGTGLGLSISYSIVQDYDGTIEVESVENEGAG
jgi:histidine kinase